MCTEVSVMYTAVNMLADSKWHELLTNHENAMDAVERYDELLNLAVEYCSRGIINSSERITLIEMATTAYTRSIAES